MQDWRFEFDDFDCFLFSFFFFFDSDYKFFKLDGRDYSLQFLKLLNFNSSSPIPILSDQIYFTYRNLIEIVWNYPWNGIAVDIDKHRIF